MSKKKSNSFNSLVYSTNPDAMQQEEQETAAVLQPEQQNLKVVLDKKQRAGKVVTLVENFIGSDDDLAELAKKLKTKCGVGGSAKDGIIIIQGDFKEKIIQWLREWRYNVK
jgi:translation initiation factor 1